MKRDLTVIVPFFNEEKSLPSVIKAVLQQKKVLEVILVDDGSTDNYFDKIKKSLTHNIKFIKHPTNQGKGQSIIDGLKKASGEYLIVQDADLEYDPGDYDLLCLLLERQQADFVIGYRDYKNSYFLNKLANIIMTIYASILFTRKINDIYCGYTLGKLKVWKSLNLKSRGFEIQAEMMAKLLKGKYKIEQVKINYSPRSYKEGKKIKAKDFFKAIYTLTKYRLSSY